MKEYKLKPHVTERDLMNAGFQITYFSNETIAIKSVAKNKKEIIIYLQPPLRVLRWRFFSDSHLPLEPHIKDFLHLFDCEIKDEL
jgi:hypothetical protein